MMECERCGAEAGGNVCPGDGRYHRHGAIHTVDGGLELVCAQCAQTIADEWTANEILRGIEALAA
jgi:hypothetical protein